MQSKRPRETPSDIEHMENGELRRMGTGSVTRETGDSRSAYLKNILTALRQPWKWLVVDREPSQGASNLDQQWSKRTLGSNDHSKYRAGVEKQQVMINEAPETAYAVENLSRQLAGSSEPDMQDLKQCVRYTLGHSDEWLFQTMQDKPRKTDEVATIEVFTDADWAGDTKSMKSTSSVFTRIDGFTIGVNAQLQDTHAQSSGESEFYALGAGCADGLHVKAILDDLGMQAKINLRCDAKASIGTETRFVLAYTTRESEVLVRARSRQSERSRSVESCDRCVVLGEGVGKRVPQDNHEFRYF